MMRFCRRGTNGVSTNGVTANCMLILFMLRLVYVYYLYVYPFYGDLILFIETRQTVPCRWEGRESSQNIARKGTTGASTNVVTANFMFFDRGTLLVLPLTYFCISKVPGRTFCPNLSNIVTVAATPWVLTPIVRKQAGPGGGANMFNP